LQLLYDLENTAIKLVEQLNGLRENEVTSDMVVKQEKIRYGEYKSKRKDIATEKEEYEIKLRQK